MLLERLKKEFDENYEVSKRTSSTNSSGGGNDSMEAVAATSKPQIVTPKATGGFKSFFGVGGTSLGKGGNNSSSKQD
jgi:hypothetical protein